MKTLATLLLLVLAVPGQSADYGVKTRFQKEKPLAFPDCELTFTGTRREASSVYPKGFLLYDFTVRSGGEKADVSCSAGTGLIAPGFFRVNGREFVLELKGSRSFKGWMKEDELVLWKRADFETIKP